MNRINWRASPLHAAVVGFANTAVQLASSFGVHLTAGQDESITSCMNAGLIVVSMIVITATNGNGNGKA